jgi:hypothetical protein
MKIENSYDFLELKHNIKIEEDLLHLIDEVFETAQLQVHKFIETEKKLSKEISPKEIYREKSLYEKIIKSKNWIITTFHKSKYAPILIRYIDQPKKIADEIAWEWIKLEANSISFYTETNLKILKTELTEVLYHYLISRITDIGKYLSTDKVLFSSLPNSEMIELTHFNELQNEIDYQKKVNSIYQQDYEEQINKIHSENHLLKEKVEKLKGYKTDLEELSGRFFFHQDNLYKDYIIGDSLPELKMIYQFLKKNNVYDSNWGYFAYCFSDAGLHENDHLKITLNLYGTEFTNNDIGYILFLIRKNYQYEHQFKFEKWFYQNIEIITKQNKLISTNKDRMSRFINENIRSYERGSKIPQNFKLINQELQFLL